MISVIIITFRRKDEILTCLKSISSQDYDNFEIIIVDNNIEQQFSDYILTATKDNPKLRYVKNQQNSSVSGGRNLGVANAKGDICVFIDDDAFFEHSTSLRLTAEKMEKEKEIAILAYKIVNYTTKQITPKEFPFKNKKINPDQEAEASYFLGGAHAVRREVFNAVGGFSQDFVYGMEELDLSFRLLDERYKIIYFPSVVVWHNPSASGRMSNKLVWRNILENRLKVGIRNLPWRYFLVNFIVWSGKALKESKSLTVLINTYSSLIKNGRWILNQRKVIKPETVKRLKKLDNRLYY